MSDLPPPSPFDEQANDLFDAGADAPAGDAALAARLAELHRVRDLLADVPPVDPGRRERSILAALAAFDAERAADTDDDAPAEPTVAPVVPLAPRTPAAPRRTPAAPRRPVRSWILGAAAVAVVFVGIALVARNGSDGGAKSSSLAVGTTAGAASESPAAAGGVAQDSAESVEAARAAPAAASTAAASATTAAGGGSGRTGGSPTTTAAASATTAARPSPAAASTAAGVAATTAGSAAPLPYFGEVGSVADLDRVITAVTGRTPTVTTSAGSFPPAGDGGNGDEVRAAFARSSCPWPGDGAPIALVRYQGEPAALVLRPAAGVAEVWLLGECRVVANRPL